MKRRQRRATDTRGTQRKGERVSDVGSVLPNVDALAGGAIEENAGEEAREGEGEGEVMAQLGWFEVGEGDSNGSSGG